MRRGAIIRASIFHVALVVGAIAMLIPFFWMASTSFKALAETDVYPPVWVPQTLHWENYVEAVLTYGIGRAFVNSLVVTIFVLIGQLITCSFGAYAFARLRFPGRDALFLGYLATMMIPHEVTIIPMYGIFWSLRLINTYAALIIPGLFSPFGTFLLRQFFKQVPLVLDEAIRIDGGNEWTSYWHIVLPLSKSALGALAIFTFLGSWNDLFWPLVVVDKKELFTIPLALAMMVGQFVTVINVQMAGATLSSLPIIVAFLLAQRQFISSIVLSGVKG